MAHTSRRSSGRGWGRRNLEALRRRRSHLRPQPPGSARRQARARCRRLGSRRADSPARPVAAGPGHRALKPAMGASPSRSRAPHETRTSREYGGYLTQPRSPPVRGRVDRRHKAKPLQRVHVTRMVTTQPLRQRRSDRASVDFASRPGDAERIECVPRATKSDLARVISTSTWQEVGPRAHERCKRRVDLVRRPREAPPAGATAILGTGGPRSDTTRERRPITLRTRCAARSSVRATRSP
jgi:hypothetical protein